MNDVADRLARDATNKPMVDIETTMSLSRIKKRIKDFQCQWETESIQSICCNGSESLNHYLYVSQNSTVTYGKALSKVDTIVMRLRLGYKYCWQYIEGDGIPCKLCGQPYSHTLHHYVMFCRELSEFRNTNLCDFKTQVCHFINSDAIPKIVKKFKHFTLIF